MIRRLKYIAFTLTLACLFGRCKDTYVSPYVTPPTGYLVVEGFIAGNGPTQFRLSRTFPLPGNTPPAAETNAQLQVEGDDNSIYPLSEQGNGIYGIDTLPLDPTRKYRVHIHTTANKDYISDFTPFRPTPAIDSINWKVNGDILDIYSNTHDPANITRYYQWDYTETWKYYSAESADGIYDEAHQDVKYRAHEDQIFFCWKTRNSTTLILGSSAKLANDVIYEHLINQLNGVSQELSDSYSIIVRQYALTEDAYNYLTLMQKNSESLGSIFDAQPSRLKGNIHSLNDPKEEVIGFVSAGTVRQQRIFIERRQLPHDWRYFYNCPMPDTLVKDSPEEYKKWFQPGSGYLPIYEHADFFGNIDGWMANQVGCVDCRLQGGTTTKPSFWPN